MLTRVALLYGDQRFWPMETPRFVPLVASAGHPVFPDRRGLSSLIALIKLIGHAFTVWTFFETFQMSQRLYKTDCDVHAMYMTVP